MTVKEKDDTFFGRGGPALDLEMKKAKGSFIYDSEGKEYVDFLGGAGVGNLGWGLDEIEMVIRNSERPSYVYPHFYYKPWTDLAELLSAVTPEHLKKSFRTTGGSEAVDAALQMAMMYTGRKKIMSIEGSYHGNTFGALSVSKSANGEKFHNLLHGCDKIAPPLNQESLDQIGEKLKTNEYAAFIMEPVIVNLGVVIPEESFMKKLDELCKAHGTLLIIDEAITGFFRTGKFFASEHFDIKPDIMCLAKAISSGYAGMGAVMTTEEVASAVEGKVGLYSSYGWHPIGTDAAIATINYLINHTEELLDNMEDIEKIFMDQLPKIQFREEPEIRIKGLAIAVDVKDEEYASEIKKKALEHGLLMNTEGSSLSFLPALNIEREIVLKGIKILKEVVE